MTSRIAGSTRLLALLAVAGLSCTSSPLGTVIVPATATVRLGASQTFVTGQRAAWYLGTGPGHGRITRDGVFYAPYFLPIDPNVTVAARLVAPAASGVLTSEARVWLEAGPIDSAACVGAGQDRVPTMSESLDVEVRPRVVTRVPPAYPELAREAGVDGTVHIAALVCRSGLVIAVRTTKSVPMLDAAGEQAVRQWIFEPGRTAGSPAATWTVVPVEFRR